jgi:hypothetical protein
MLSVKVKYGSKIAYESETYDAWKAGVSPDAFARAQPQPLGRAHAGDVR